MFLRYRILGWFALFFLFSDRLCADDSFRMNASYFVRSTAHFGDNSDNKVGVLTKGSTFKVLQTKTLSNGAQVAEIHVTRLSANSNLNPASHYWIYMGDKSHFTALSTSETEAAAAPDDCADCRRDRNRGNTGSIADVSNAITARQNQPPVGTTDTVTEAARPPGAFDDIIKKYSQSPQVDRCIDYAMKHKTKRSRGQCYRSVKEALTCARAWHTSPGNCLLSDYPGGKAALGAKEQLKKLGFINLLEHEPYKTTLKSAKMAPKGAVLVYSSGIPCDQTPTEEANRSPIIGDCGHVEIKTDEPGKPGYVSDYWDDNPINETAGAVRYTSRYKLVGVMIKPEVETP